MLQFVDCNMAVGIPNVTQGNRIYHPQDVQRVAEQVGIVHGFAYHNGSLDIHPIEGNLAMNQITERYPFFSSVWTVLPNHIGEFYDTEVLEEMLDHKQVDMVRMFPRYDAHGYSMAEWSVGEVLDMMERRNKILLLNQEQISMEVLHKVCLAHPKLKVIITNMNVRYSRDILALMKQHDHLYIESSGMKLFGLLQTFCERIGADRIVFGSNMGTYSAGSAVCLITYALISAKEKEQIAHASLEAILERKVI